MTIESIAIDGLAAKWSPGPESTITVSPARPLSKGVATMSVVFSNDYNHNALGLYKVVSGGAPYLFTQFEAADAREAFPCWDEPGFKARFSLTATVPSDYSARAYDHGGLKPRFLQHHRGAEDHRAQSTHIRHARAESHSRHAEPAGRIRTDLALRRQRGWCQILGLSLKRGPLG